MTNAFKKQCNNNEKNCTNSTQLHNFNSVHYIRGDVQETNIAENDDSWQSEVIETLSNCQPLAGFLAAYSQISTTGYF